VRWRKARELAMIKRTGAANTPLGYLDLVDAAKHRSQIKKQRGAPLFSFLHTLHSTERLKIIRSTLFVFFHIDHGVRGKPIVSFCD